MCVQSVGERDERTKSPCWWLHRPSLKLRSKGSSEKPNWSLVKKREADITTKGHVCMEVEIEDILPQTEELARDPRKEPHWREE